jgi:hypothetical protein
MTWPCIRASTVGLSLALGDPRERVRRIDPGTLVALTDGSRPTYRSKRMMRPSSDAYAPLGPRYLLLLQVLESPSLVLVINDTKLLMSLCQVN